MEHHTSVLTEQEASRIAKHLYGIEASAKLLPGELDQNFYLRTSQGQEFVLKISHASEQWNILDLQNQALQHLATHTSSLVLPRVCPTTTGALIGTVVNADETERFVRLLTYIPGRLLAQTNPHTPELLYSVGHMLGTLDSTLHTFTHPAAQRTLKWDVQQASWIHEYTHFISQPERRSLVERFLAQFETSVLPALLQLRTGMIHNDGNDYNVVIAASPSGQQQAMGVIDFGDMVYAPILCELAIATAYAILDKADPLTAASHIVAGYHSAFPLTEAELSLLFPLICTRLCVSVTNSAYQQTIEPDNDYLRISERSAWALLEQLATIPQQLAHYTFRHACGLPACPTTPAIVSWLEQNTDRIRSIVEPAITSANSLIFDLSVGSLELGNQPDFTDTVAFTHRLFERMRTANASIGIGKYNEARPIYTAEMFKEPGEHGTEARTIHLGIDLFMEPGSPVYAPLDGLVHSLNDNKGIQNYGPTIILQHSIAHGELTFYTLYGHLSTDSLDGLQEGMPITRGTVIGHIGNQRENGGWSPHLHFQIISDLLDREGEFPGVARASQRDIWLSLSPDPNLFFGIPQERLTTKRLSSKQILEARSRHIGKNMSISYRKPLNIVRGYMQHLYDEDGRSYLDAVNNVPHVGHNHPRVVKAGQQQMSVLNTNTRYLHEELVHYAERLCSTLPAPLSVCYFVCSGSEANELALRLAYAHTRQKDVVVLEAGYHGNTTTLIDISSYKFDGRGGAGAQAYVHKVSLPDLYRGYYKQYDPQAGEKYALQVANVAEQFQGKISAFICESLPGCGGQIVLPENYLKEVYHYIRNAGGVCIADEVQVGFGRVGTHFWGFETQDVVPDIVTMGKPIGNGHPLAAVVTTPEIAASFDNGMEYFNTFGGNPVSCAIGLAVLDVIAEEKLQENALKTGTLLLDGLSSLMDKHQLIGDVRGLGLYIGVELVQDRATLEPAEAQASYIANRMRECGILISTDGPLHNVLKIKPPLVFNEADANLLIKTLDKILDEDFVQVHSEYVLSLHRPGHSY
jgi:4-aminobutyrate aminotransferase-like enzyme/Ser/Thr protein kinase RdoA (MazF antagonist)